MIWDDALLDELRLEGDPTVDEMVRERLAEQPVASIGPEHVRVSMVKFMAEFAVRQDRPSLADRWYAEAIEPPSWMKPELLKDGQRFFADHGLEMSVALFFASLPLSYAVPDAALVLRRSSDLATGNFTRRVAETGHMLIDVMGLQGDGSFRPGGRAHATCSGLRVLHGFVRQLVASHDVELRRPSVPLNQELLVSTILDFTLVTWMALERMGVPVPPQERCAHLHAWSVVGHLLGIRPDLLPLKLEDVGGLQELLQRRHLPALGQCATLEGVELAEALIGEMRSFMPLGWGRLPATLVRWLYCGAPGPVAEVPAQLRIPPASAVLWLLLDVQRWLNRQVAGWPVAGYLSRRLSRRVGRSVIIALSILFAPDRAPFDVPPELARRWGLPRSRPVRAAHAARLRVRRAVRSYSPRGSGRR